MGAGLVRSLRDRLPLVLAYLLYVLLRRSGSKLQFPQVKEKILPSSSEEVLLLKCVLQSLLHPYHTVVNSLVELEYFLEEVCKATTDQLDWNNPEGQQYPHDLRKPLPLIPNSRVTKTKTAEYDTSNRLNGLSYQTRCEMWSQVPSVYDKHALWGISHWGRKRQQFYGFAVNRESARDVYSKHRILAVIKLKIVEWHNYKHSDMITVRKNDDKLYTFKEGDYNRLRLQDIEDMLLLLVKGKLTNLNVEERLALGVSLRIFTRSVVLRRRVKDL
ncbi:hypothetical protein Tco_0967967 [Tanacetum coccineum]